MGYTLNLSRVVLRYHKNVFGTETHSFWSVTAVSWSSSEATSSVWALLSCSNWPYTSVENNIGYVLLYINKCYLFQTMYVLYNATLDIHVTYTLHVHIHLIHYATVPEPIRLIFLY